MRELQAARDLGIRLPRPPGRPKVHPMPQPAPAAPKAGHKARQRPPLPKVSHKPAWPADPPQPPATLAGYRVPRLR